MIEELIKIYERDLDKLKDEIDSFQEERNLWEITGNIKNSAGNLCLHLAGNLNTYIGKNIGNTGYVRDREAEFNQKNVAKSDLLRQVDQTKQVVVSSLKGIGEQALEQVYPEHVLGYEMKTGFFIVHLACHLSYHLGQINYLRRVLEK